MGRKKISTYKLNKLKKMINEGKTIKETSETLKISVATVSNYKAFFNKKDETALPSKKNISADNVLTKKENKQTLNIKIPTSEIKGYAYIINGTKLTFDSQPKEILFSEDKIIIEI